MTAEEIEQEAVALWNLDRRSGAQRYHGCEWDELSEAGRNKFRKEAGGVFFNTVPVRAILESNHDRA